MATGIFNNMTTAFPPSEQKPIAQQATRPSQEISVKNAIAAQQSGDTYVPSTVKNSQGKGLKGFIARVKSGFATLGEYTKGTLKGIKSGLIAGSIVYTAGSGINYLKDKAAAKVGTVAKKIPNKFLAGATAAIALGINLWNASLNANQKRSDIYHRWIGD